jgi:hypothetical protein
MKYSKTDKKSKIHLNFNIESGCFHQTTLNIRVKGDRSEGYSSISFSTSLNFGKKLNKMESNHLSVGKRMQLGIRRI